MRGPRAMRVGCLFAKASDPLPAIFNNRCVETRSAKHGGVIEDARCSATRSRNHGQIVCANRRVRQFQALGDPESAPRLIDRDTTLFVSKTATCAERASGAASSSGAGRGPITDGIDLHQT